MAGLSRLYARMAAITDDPARSFVILAIDVGEVELRVRRFFDKEPVPFPVLLDEDRAVTKRWKANVLPSSFVLDASHTLRLYAGGPVDWDDPAADHLLHSLTTPVDAETARQQADHAALPLLNE